MKLVYINPNATEAMTDGIVRTAREALPEAEIFGLTNTEGPPSIEGAADGDAAVPGLLIRLSEAQTLGAEAIVIACFDDTGLARAQAAASCPVIGLGQASFVAATLLGRRFSVITSQRVSIPVIEANIAAQGFAGTCASVRAVGLPVLTIDAGGDAVVSRICEEIAAARIEDGAECVLLGCAGMGRLVHAIAARTEIPVIEGIAAAAHLATAALRIGPR